LPIVVIFISLLSPKARRVKGSQPPLPGRENRSMPSSAQPAIDVANADLLLSTTRAVRRRLDLERPVEREVILECLRLAVQAPTASNRQRWRWMVVTDAGLRSRIAEIYREQGMGYLRATLAEAEREGDDQQRRVFESALYLAENLERVPVLVIPCIAEEIDFSRGAAAAGALGSVIQAAWSFQLALRARGLGSAWTTFHLSRSGEVADLLGIPDGVTQVALLPVAYTKGTGFRPARRPPVEEITHWDRWT
jgi:nitroreductase